MNTYLRLVHHRIRNSQIIARKRNVA